MKADTIGSVLSSRTGGNMKKEELEAIFAVDGVPPDLGPIGPYLDEVASAEALPSLAVAVCTARIEETGPVLCALLEKAAAGEILSDDEANLLFRGAFILGGARHTPAFRPIVRLVRRRRDEVESLLGDAITESLPRIVAGVFDGDADTLFGVIEDRAIDEFVRGAFLQAATFLTWDSRIEPDRMRRFLERFHEERLADQHEYVWIAWLEAVALLGLRELAPLVHRAWDQDLLPPKVLYREDFEKDLAAAESAPRDPERFENARLGYIEDVIEALEWTDQLDDIRDEFLREMDARLLDDPDLAPFPDSYSPIPVTNPMRHVGRNDPCPCGSGKKAKKCCLAG